MHGQARAGVLACVKGSSLAAFIVCACDACYEWSTNYLLLYATQRLNLCDRVGRWLPLVLLTSTSLDTQAHTHHTYTYGYIYTQLARAHTRKWSRAKSCLLLRHSCLCDPGQWRAKSKQAWGTHVPAEDRAAGRLTLSLPVSLCVPGPPPQSLSVCLQPEQPPVAGHPTHTNNTPLSLPSCTLRAVSDP